MHVRMKWAGSAAVAADGKGCDVGAATVGVSWESGEDPWVAPPAPVFASGDDADELPEDAEADLEDDLDDEDELDEDEDDEDDLDEFDDDELDDEDDLDDDDEADEIDFTEDRYGRIPGEDDGDA